MVDADGTPRCRGAQLPHDAVVESWIHVEIDRETDRDDLKQITADLRRVLSDVRESVEDWRRCATRALRIADELAASLAADAARAARSGRPGSCCAGWPTTTSPSSATASTG